GAVAALAVATAAGAAGEKTVLTFYPESRLLPVGAILDQAIRTTLQSRSGATIFFLTEYLDMSWFGGPGPEDQIAFVLKQKYAGRKGDLIMVCGDAAVGFVLRWRGGGLPRGAVGFCRVRCGAPGEGG